MFLGRAVPLVDPVIGQGYRLVSAVALGGSQTVLPDQMVLLGWTLCSGGASAIMQGCRLCPGVGQGHS